MNAVSAYFQGMNEKWTRIKAWLKENCPDLLSALNPGASEADFAQLERITGQVLPEDFKAFYRIHNGQNQHREGIWAGEELLSTYRIAEEWGIWKQLLDQGEFKDTDPSPDEGIRKAWFSAAWLPLTYDGAGNHDCLDLDPTPEGIRGQVLRMWHDDAERYLVAVDFEDWIDTYIEDLETGAMAYDENFGIVESDGQEDDDEHDHDHDDEHGHGHHH
jgi:cell wall assembly regulator SMI1